ncbi:hypothetical protein LXA43DRAFT_1062381 [Ganoderma leucocontextum]|nr:hypothetical protein LXA43DRAFT_1062381 [Ganoderma leucocontextum]
MSTLKRQLTIGQYFKTMTGLLYFAPLSASNTGFSLAMAAAFSNNILSWVHVFNDLETSGNSLERIQQYLLIEHEPKSTPAGIPPAYWPASGNLEVKNLSARYSRTAPKCCTIYPSMLPLQNALALPKLLSGMLHQNLDPFSEHDDSVLNDVLRSTGLFNLQNEKDESRIMLDSDIAGGGANLAQRQVLALARAIVRRSKLLILDEATSAIATTYSDCQKRDVLSKLGTEQLLNDQVHLVVWYPVVSNNIS